MEFDNYLKQKKIDPILFKKSEGERYVEWKTLFDQVHPDNFTQQKLFLLNQTRRTYLLKETQDSAKPKSGSLGRPVIKPMKPKTK